MGSNPIGTVMSKSEYCVEAVIDIISSLSRVQKESTRIMDSMLEWNIPLMVEPTRPSEKDSIIVNVPSNKDGKFTYEAIIEAGGIHSSMKLAAPRDITVVESEGYSELQLRLCRDNINFQEQIEKYNVDRLEFEKNKADFESWIEANRATVKNLIDAISSLLSTTDELYSALDR